MILSGQYILSLEHFFKSSIHLKAFGDKLKSQSFQPYYRLFFEMYELFLTADKIDSNVINLQESNIQALINDDKFRGDLAEYLSSLFLEGYFYNTLFFNFTTALFPHKEFDLIAYNKLNNQVLLAEVKSYLFKGKFNSACSYYEDYYLAFDSDPCLKAYARINCKKLNNMKIFLNNFSSLYPDFQDSAKVLALISMLFQPLSLGFKYLCNIVVIFL